MKLCSRHACGRWADGQLGRSTRITQRAASAHSSAKVAVGRNLSHSCQLAGRGPSGGHGCSKWIGLASKLFQNGNGGGASSGTSSSMPLSSSGPGTSGGCASSCSRPSLSAVLHTRPSRIGFPPWVIDTRWELATRPSRIACTSMSMTSNLATPR
jgi:hypothetical protein